MGILSCSSLNINRGTGSNITLPTSYSSAPLATCLGYMLQVKNSTAVSMGNTVIVSLCTITLPPRIWIVFSVACFFPTSSCTFLQAGISASATIFDDFSEVQQYTDSNSSNGCLVNVPMRYYCGNGITFYLNGLCFGCTANANTSAGYYSTLRAVRVG